MDNFPQNFVCVYLYLSFIEVSSVTCLMICFMCFLHLKFRDAVGGFTQKFLWIPIVFDPPKLPLRVTHPQKLGETHGSNWLRSLRDKPVIGDILSCDKGDIDKSRQSPWTVWFLPRLCKQKEWAVLHLVCPSERISLFYWAVKFWVKVFNQHFLLRAV